MFSYETLKAKMQARAATPDVPPAPLESFLSDLTYDDYRNIGFRKDTARWADTDLAFHIEAFHPGWLFPEPVQLHEVVDGTVQKLSFSVDDFNYYNGLDDRVPAHAELAGVAGLKISHPLNRTDIFDELITFLGASYFRALGRGNSYGLSARGLSINTWLDGPEEFPRFSEFWIERPAIGAQNVTVYAALDSASVTGAYRFDIAPGTNTIIDVEATLYFRNDVTQLGLGPLTSMFYFAEYSPHKFNDFRPQVHDSDALKVVRQDGEVLVRPLNNPPRVSSSYFVEPEMAQFGLVQRDRDYESYQDAGARYHDRPSVMIEPLSDWGAGAIRLVEIPAALEIEDNIALFWVPEDAPKAGQSRSYRYRMHWGANVPDAQAEIARVQTTRAGVGGPSGVPVTNPGLRKFVVDFDGGYLSGLPEDAEVKPVVTLSAGTLGVVVLHKVQEVASGRWRLVINVDGEDAELIELTAHIAGRDRKLSETWLFQWVRDPQQDASN